MNFCSMNPGVCTTGPVQDDCNFCLHNIADTFGDLLSGFIPFLRWIQEW
jgi:hypothetical protein